MNCLFGVLIADFLLCLHNTAYVTAWVVTPAAGGGQRISTSANGTKVATLTSIYGGRTRVSTNSGQSWVLNDVQENGFHEQTLYVRDVKYSGDGSALYTVEG